MVKNGWHVTSWKISSSLAGSRLKTKTWSSFLSICHPASRPAPPVHASHKGCRHTLYVSSFNPFSCSSNNAL
jgi:hypothetical protein